MKDQEKLKNRQQENKNKIIDTTVALITKEGVDSITVRHVCETANICTGTFYYYFKNKDELLLSFIMECFDDFELQTPITDISGRIVELYTILIDKYLSFGKEFMRSFYTPSNAALSAYMCETNGAFQSGTIMARCEKEIDSAIHAGIIPNTINAHKLSEDICIFIKGIIFEYSLNNKDFNIRQTTERIIRGYVH